ncbi:diacylglycerol kinase (ATP) [Micromonospora pattaloongensis]|uniref:Diacylglycerol kinase (ATP) n=1 Tax=Micromonospora pattaloongensis TaxID=405436 RepID=A0A1H3LZ09_9ACTN|nr:diacylglycerol kinase family protein [Micromonospora pattaloongensis]SDY69650.1 diacylglycerol kinase (ATP) [Micromonospora pattaloongensis]
MSEPAPGDTHPASAAAAGMLVLTNDAAGRTQADAIATVLAELRGGGDDVELATCYRDADLPALLDQRGDRLLIVVGGDGSLHTTLKHLWRRGESRDCVVGLIPLGTGNDFARGTGIPLDPRDAARAVLHGTPRALDLITDDVGDVVVNAVHVGVGADAAAAARPLKRRLRQAAFPLGALLAGVRARGWRLRVTLDGVVLASGARPVLMAGLANAPSIAGGTATLGPDAAPTDGAFDVTVSFATAPLARLGYALRLLRGRHPERPDVLYRTGRTLTIEGEPFHTNADGELAGPVTRRTWTLHPRAWRCLLPTAP